MHQPVEAARADHDAAAGPPTTRLMDRPMGQKLVRPRRTQLDGAHERSRGGEARSGVGNASAMSSCAELMRNAAAEKLEAEDLKERNRCTHSRSGPGSESKLELDASANHRVYRQ